jgi:hypothetical protein
LGQIAPQQLSCWPSEMTAPAPPMRSLMYSPLALARARESSIL